MFIKNRIFVKGFLTTLALTILVLIIFYGKLLLHLNIIFFGSSGDTMQTYYTTLYHFKYDKYYFHHDGMNYPFGESFFFTAGHTPVINVLKTLHPFVDIFPYLIFCINLTMLASIVLCALCIYLIFKSLKLPVIYSAAAAIGITFLSPQIHRLGGTLSYEFAIPAFIYLLIKFNRAPSLKISLLIAFLVFFLMMTYLYFFAFNLYCLFCYLKRFCF